MALVTEEYRFSVARGSVQAAYVQVTYRFHLKYRFLPEKIKLRSYLRRADNSTNFSNDIYLRR